MHAYLLAFETDLFVKKQIQKMMDSLQISKKALFEVSSQAPLSIEEVRDLKHHLKYKADDLSKKLYVIHHLDQASPAALNSLLKILEEPPEWVFFILPVRQINRLPLTILSRCQIISEKKEALLGDKTRKKEVRDLLFKIISSSPAERILLNQSLSSSKEQAINLVESLTEYLRLALYEKKNQELDRPAITLLLTKLHHAKQYLESNVNYKAVMDVLFLGFPVKDRKP